MIGVSLSLCLYELCLSVQGDGQAVYFVCTVAYRDGECFILSTQPLFHNTNFDIVVIGASLGGLDAINQIVSRLPADFPAPLVVVQHRAAGYPDLLRDILQPKTALQVQNITPGDRLKAGTLYLAPAGQHLIVANGRLDLQDGPKISFARPSIDVLFESAVQRFGNRTLGVVLTGRLHDGARGASLIQAQGGCVIVQDRQTSRAFEMPHAAIRTGGANFVLPVEKIAHTLITLVMVQGALHVFRGTMPMQEE